MRHQLQAGLEYKWVAGQREGMGGKGGRRRGAGAGKGQAQGAIVSGVGLHMARQKAAADRVLRGAASAARVQVGGQEKGGQG